MHQEDIEAVACRVLELSLELQLKALRQMAGKALARNPRAPRPGAETSVSGGFVAHSTD